MEIDELLSEAGLTERESRVYRALLALGLTTTGPLAKRSGVPTSKIYDVLESLQDKGLISWVVKGKTKYFQGANPDKILSLFKEKERRIAKAIPQLQAERLKVKEKQYVELFEGPKAIFAFLNDLIEQGKKGDVYYGFSLGKEYEDEAFTRFYKKYTKLRKEKKLTVKLIANKSTKKVFNKVYSDQKTYFKKTLRFVDFHFPQGLTIFGDKVLTINWIDRPIAVLIQSKTVADQYKQYFEELWSTAKY